MARAETFGHVEVLGLKSALRTINNYDKRLRREITQEFRQIIQPVVDEATRLIPVRPPLSGWDRSWTPRGSDSAPVLPWGYRSGGSRKNRTPVKSFVSGKQPKTHNGYTRDLVAMGYRWTTQSAVLFDVSNGGDSAQGRRMNQILTRRYGHPSRAMWKAYEIAGLDVQYEIRQVVKKTMDESRRLLRENRYR